MKWDPNKKPPGTILLLTGGLTHCFNILFSYWFSITTIKNPIVPNQKKRKCYTNPFFFLGGGVLVIGRRDYIALDYITLNYAIYNTWWHTHIYMIHTFSNIIYTSFDMNFHMQIELPINLFDKFLRVIAFPGCAGKSLRKKVPRGRRIGGKRFWTNRRRAGAGRDGWMLIFHDSREIR